MPLADLGEDLGSVLTWSQPSVVTVPSDLMFFLASEDTRHARGAHTSMQAKHPYTKNKINTSFIKMSEYIFTTFAIKNIFHLRLTEFDDVESLGPEDYLHIEFSR